MVQVTFLIDTQVLSEAIHKEDLEDFLDSATDHNITIIDIS